MLTTLVFLTALPLTAGQATRLSLLDARATYGILGPTRPDNKLRPGDSMFVTFDIAGLTTDEEGKVLYSISTSATDSRGKVQFNHQPQDHEAINTLGGTRLPAFAQVDVGLEQPPGEYTLKVTVTDRASKKSQTLTQDFQVLPKAFGLVRLHMTSDADARVPAGLLGPGQSLWVNGVVVGFERDRSTKQPHVNLQLRVLNDEGQATVAKPFAGTINKDVPSNANSLPIQFFLALNRAGKFTVELKATDQVTGKSITQSFPLTVQAKN